MCRSHHLQTILLEDLQVPTHACNRDTHRSEMGSAYPGLTTVALSGTVINEENTAQSALSPAAIS